MDAKWSEGSPVDDKGLSTDFPKLSVKVRDEIVSFGVPEEIVVGAEGIQGGGTKLSPQELEAMVADRDVVFFDGRNAREAEIGRFRGAVIPDVRNTRDFVAELDSGKYDHLKDKPVVTYCTGGIRCEVLTPLMKARGFTEVYQLDGGIVRYGEHAGNDGLWEGSLYVFDGRISMDFAPETVQIGTCALCKTSTNRMVDCHGLSCREQLVFCDDCALTSQPGCSAHSAHSAVVAL